MFSHQSMQLVQQQGNLCLTTLGKGCKSYAVWIKAEPKQDNPNGIYCVGNGSIDLCVEIWNRYKGKYGNETN